MKEYIYGLINKTTGLIIDQTSIDEENEELAKEIMLEGRELEDYEEIELVEKIDEGLE